jgi:uncharacterized membrane protein
MTGMLQRFVRHVTMTPWKARAAFPDAVMDAIQREIGAQEKRHRGEVRFVVERELTSAQLWAGMTSRQRAIEVFSMLQVWDTEDNTGVLIYVLLADHKVEVVADRGIQKKVGTEAWVAIVEAMDAHFRAGRFQEGALGGVRAVSELLAQHFPCGDGGANELPDRPLLI